MRTRSSFFAAISSMIYFASTPLTPGGTHSLAKVGDPAPIIETQDQEGRPWKLNEHTGKGAVLVYFYPKDNTPGCTKQACGLRDQMSELNQNGVEVVGVSFDDAESHKSFIKKHGLNFPLLVDKNGKAADAYGVRVPGQNRARRVSFLIGPDGRILHVTDSPSADTHLAEMKTAIAKFKGAAS